MLYIYGMKTIRTRYAPSPTGYNHSAGLRTAIYNYLFAKKYNGEFFIRIEDTDQKRYNNKAEEYIKDSFEWIGIKPDDSPWNPNPKYGEYYQSKRDYSVYVEYLLENNFAYKAYDTPEELEQIGLPYTRANRHLFKNDFTILDEEVKKQFTSYVVRINVPENKTIVLNDMIRGDISFNTNNIDDKVLLKSDNIPTYHLAHVVDDMLMETTHIIRGDEWIPSTPIHLLLWNMFGWEKPIYAHLSVILNPDGNGKLSKRTAFKKGFEIFPLPCSEDDVDFKGFAGLGYEPLAYVNFISLLGHSFGKDVLLSLNDMIDSFDLMKVSTSPSIFDINKLDFINKSHLLDMDNNELWKRFDYDISIYDNSKLNRIMNLAKDRAVKSDDLKNTIDIFFTHTKTIDISDTTKNLLKDKTDISKDWIKESKINMKELREVLCSGKSGPELSEVADIIGSDELLKRINKYC